MAGRHSALWDHVVQVYLPQARLDRLRRALPTRGWGTAWIGAGAGSIYPRPLRRWLLRRPRLVQRTAILAAVILPGVAAGVLLWMAAGEGPRSAAQNIAGRAVVAMLALGTGAALFSGAVRRRQEASAFLMRVRRVHLVRRAARAGPEMLTELADRRAWWAHRLAQHSRMVERARFGSVDPWATLLASAPVVWVLATPLFARTVGPVSFLIWPLVTIAVFVAGPVYQSIALRRVRRSLQRCITDGVCADCGYDLRSLRRHPDSAAATDGPGPERCPECGSPWPLVPPPIMPEPAVDDGAELAKPVWQRHVGRMVARWRRRLAQRSGSSSAADQMRT